MLFALLLPVMLGLIALVTDLGSMYLARDRLNSLVRTGAATALKMRALKGWAAMRCSQTDEYGYTSSCNGNNAAIQDVLDAMKAAIVENIKEYFPGDTDTEISNYLRFRAQGSDSWSSSISASALGLSNTDEAIRLQVQYYAPTLFVSNTTSIFGASLCTRPPGDPNSNRCMVTSDATSPIAGYLRGANIYLMLDTSGSMQQSISGQRKSDALKKAVGHFIDSFNPYNDQIALVPFSTGATVARGLGTFELASANGRLEIKDQVIGLQSAGQTNPCDALIRTIDLVKQNRAAAQAAGGAPSPSFAVLFTDGAPNVYRLGFCEQSGPNACGDRPSPLKLQSGQGLVDNDWYGWTVKWGQRVTAQPTPVGTNTDYTKDPVFGLPSIRNSASQNPALTQTGVEANNTISPGNLVMDQSGKFRYKATNSQWYTLNNVPAAFSDPDGPYTLAFNSLTRDRDNYLWNGPSYLVNASYNIRNQNALIDRITRVAGDTTPVTCGPPTSSGADQFNYNHSRYFASRVVDAGWSFESSKAKTGLSVLQGSFPTINGNTYPLIPHLLSFTPPLDTSNPQPTAPYPALQMPTQAPGCLTSLNAVVPKTDNEATIFVGSSFIANHDEASIKDVGEIVKTAELPYYCAIRAADYLRELGVITFVVGIGTPASSTYGASCNDPLQNALDFDARKDYFLRRLAFAPEALTDAATFIETRAGAWDPNHNFGFQNQTISCTNHPLNGITVSIGYGDSWNGDSNSEPTSTLLGSTLTPDELGNYYPSTSPSELTPIFGKIAKQILARMAM